MTTKDIALTLATQFVHEESEMYWNQIHMEIYKVKNLEKYQEYKRERDLQRAKMKTIESNAVLLGISSAEWEKAVHEAYLTKTNRR